MNTNRRVVGFVTVLVMTGDLAFGDFASSASAKTIVVTTLTDTADPPFDADDPYGTGTVANLPGADGLISLREAISAANNNQVTARVERNVVEDSTVLGIGLAAGGTGVVSDNTLHVRVAHNTVCGDGPDIVAEGGFSGNVLLSPNQGSGNVLDGEIPKNTATTVTVANGTAGNTATVTQNNNTPCP